MIDTTDTEKHRIGLSNTERRIKLIYGSAYGLFIESKENQYTKVVLRIPAEKGGEMRVLIVDDEALVRVGLKSMINWESYGFELIGEASDGRIALEMAKNTPPDILITDLKMPVLDGLELIRRVKKDYPNCKVIVLSSYDDFSLVREAMKLGAADYLLKLEVEPAQLINTLRGLKDDIVQERHYRQETQTNLGVLRRDFLCHALCSHESNEADF